MINTQQRFGRSARQTQELEKLKIELASIEHALTLIDSDHFSASEREVLGVDGQINYLKGRKRRLTKLIDYTKNRQLLMMVDWREL